MYSFVLQVRKQNKSVGVLLQGHYFYTYYSVVCSEKLTVALALRLLLIPRAYE